MILIALMGARIPSGLDNFKRVIKYQTLRTSFYGSKHLGLSYQTEAIIKGD